MSATEAAAVIARLRAEPLRGKDDAARVRMREIANERRRFGYRRLAILLSQEGKGMNLK